jgi:hypothetical protein
VLILDYLLSEAFPPRPRINAGEMANRNSERPPAATVSDGLYAGERVSAPERSEQLATLSGRRRDQLPRLG